jgi:hypothetical protein
MSFPRGTGLLWYGTHPPARSTIMTTVSSTSSPAISAKRSTAQKVGIGISALVGAFLVFDAAGKLANVPQVKEGTAALGFPAGQALVMGIVLSVCVLVYAIPRTAVLGALGITAYLGGAVTANMRIEAPLFSATLFAVYFGILMWVGLVLRRPQLLKVVGLKR